MYIKQPKCCVMLSKLSYSNIISCVVSLKLTVLGKHFVIHSLTQTPSPNLEFFQVLLMRQLRKFLIFNLSQSKKVIRLVVYTLIIITLINTKQAGLGNCEAFLYLCMHMVTLLNAQRSVLHMLSILIHVV